MVCLQYFRPAPCYIIIKKDGSQSPAKIQILVSSAVLYFFPVNWKSYCGIEKRNRRSKKNIFFFCIEKIFGYQYSF